MAKVIVDSGPLLALFDKRDRKNALARAFFAEPAAALVTNLAVVSEVLFMLDGAPQVQAAAITWLPGALTIDTELPRDFARIAQLLPKYSDLPMDFADASLVALAERIGTRRISTFDSDFDVYRTAANESFENAIVRS